MTAAVAPSSWTPIPVRPYLDGSVTVEKPTMMIRTDREALLYPGKVHSFHGESESGKSMLAQVVAAEQIMAGRDVLYLDYESDPGTVGGRLVAMRVTPEQIDQHLVYVNPDAAPDRTGFEALLKRRYALAVVDGVTEALGLSGASSKDNDDVTGWMRSLPRVIAARTGAAVILVDHVTKSADSRGRFAIGAQAKMGALTGAGYMVEVRQPLGRGMVGVLTVRVAKDRPGYVRGNGGAFRSSDRSQLVAVVTIDSTGSERIRAAIDPPGDEVSAHGGPVAGFRPTVLMERVSRLIEGSVRPLSFNDLQDGAHSKRANVRAAVDVLLGEGFVVADPGPRNSLLHRSVKPYRQSDDPDSDSYTGGNQSSLETGSRLVPLVPVPYTREPGTSGSGSEGTGREPVRLSARKVVSDERPEEAPAHPQGASHHQGATRSPGRDHRPRQGVCNLDVVLGFPRMTVRHDDDCPALRPDTIAGYAARMQANAAVAGLMDRLQFGPTMVVVAGTPPGVSA